MGRPRKALSSSRLDALEVGQPGEVFRRRDNTTITKHLMRNLQEVNPKTGITYAQQLATVWMLKALQGGPGSFPYFKEIMDRLYGKVPDRVESSSEHTIKLAIIEQIKHVYGNEKALQVQAQVIDPEMLEYEPQREDADDERGVASRVEQDLERVTLPTAIVETQQCDGGSVDAQEEVGSGDSPI